MGKNPVPANHQAITPYLMVHGVAKLLDFLTRAFDAETVFKMDRDDGSVAHAEVRISGVVVMVGEPPAEFEPMPGQLYYYTADCDAIYLQAIHAGGLSIMEPTTMDFSGQRYGGVKDPSGNIWWIATHLEDVSAEDSKARFED